MSQAIPCGLCRRGAPYDKPWNSGSDCRFCYLYDTDPRYRELWGGSPHGGDVISCRHLGERDGTELCPSCRGHVEIFVSKCAVHGRCHQARGKPIAGAHCCVGCNDGPIVVWVSANGIGDTLIGLCSAAGHKVANPRRDVILRVDQPWQYEWACLFGGCDRVVLGPVKTITGLEFKLNDMDGEKGDRDYRTPRWEHQARAVGAPTAVVPQPRALPKDALEFARQYEGRIVLSPFSVWPDRAWQVPKWLSLEDELISAGLECVVLDGLASCDDAVRTEKFRSPVLRDKSAAEVAAVIKGASLLIGNDSGMAHAAGMLRTKALVISWFHDANQIYGLYGQTTVLHAPTIENRGWRDTITVEMVMRTACRLLGVAPYVKAVLPPEKLEVLKWEAARCANLPGDMAEVGVYQGGSALAICRAAPDKVVHLFDTFDGLPADDVAGGHHKKGEFRASQSEVQFALTGQHVEFHAGVFPQTAAKLGHLQFALVHLDGDLYETTRDALAWFWDKIVPGGVIVLDDVDWDPTPGVNRALEEAGFMDKLERPVPRQGILRKPLESC